MSGGASLSMSGGLTQWALRPNSNEDLHKLEKPSGGGRDPPSAAGEEVANSSRSRSRSRSRSHSRSHSHSHSHSRSRSSSRSSSSSSSGSSDTEEDSLEISNTSESESSTESVKDVGVDAVAGSPTDPGRIRTGTDPFLSSSCSSSCSSDEFKISNTTEDESPSEPHDPETGSDKKKIGEGDAPEPGRKPPKRVKGGKKKHKHKKGKHNLHKHSKGHTEDSRHSSKRGSGKRDAGKHGSKRRGSSSVELPGLDDESHRMKPSRKDKKSKKASRKAKKTSKKLKKTKSAGSGTEPAPAAEERPASGKVDGGAKPAGDEAVVAVAESEESSEMSEPPMDYAMIMGVRREAVDDDRPGTAGSNRSDSFYDEDELSEEDPVEVAAMAALAEKFKSGEADGDDHETYKAWMKRQYERQERENQILLRRMKSQQSKQDLLANIPVRPRAKSSSGPPVVSVPPSSKKGKKEKKKPKREKDKRGSRTFSKKLSKTESASSSASSSTVGSLRVQDTKKRNSSNPNFVSDVLEFKQGQSGLQGLLALANQEDFSGSDSDFLRKISSGSISSAYGRDASKEISAASSDGESRLPSESSKDVASSSPIIDGSLFDIEAALEAKVALLELSVAEKKIGRERKASGEKQPKIEEPASQQKRKMTLLKRGSMAVRRNKSVTTAEKEVAGAEVAGAAAEMASSGIVRFFLSEGLKKKTHNLQIHFVSLRVSTAENAGGLYSAEDVGAGIMNKLRMSTSSSFEQNFDIQLRLVLNGAVVQKLARKVPVSLVMKKVMLENPGVEFGTEENHFACVSGKRTEHKSGKSPRKQRRASVSSAKGGTKQKRPRSRSNSRAQKKDGERGVVGTHLEPPSRDEKVDSVDEAQRKDQSDAASGSESDFVDSSSDDDEAAFLDEYGDQWWATGENIRSKHHFPEEPTEAAEIRKALLAYAIAQQEARKAAQTARRTERKMRAAGAATVANFRTWQASQQEEKENLENELQDLDEQGDAVEEENEEFEKGCEGATRDLDKTRSKLEKFQKKSETVVATKEEYLENLGLLFKELEHLEEVNAELRQEMEKATQQIEDVERESAETRELLEAASDELDTIQVDVETQLLTHKSLEAQLRRLKRMSMSASVGTMSRETGLRSSVLKLNSPPIAKAQYQNRVKPIAELPSSTSSVTSVCVFFPEEGSNGSHFVFVGLEDGSLRVFSAGIQQDKHQSLHVTSALFSEKKSAHGGRITSLSKFGQQLWSAAADRTIYIWSCSRMAFSKKRPLDGRPLRKLTFTPMINSAKKKESSEHCTVLLSIEDRFMVAGGSHGSLNVISTTGHLLTKLQQNLASVRAGLAVGALHLSARKELWVGYDQNIIVYKCDTIDLEFQQPDTWATKSGAGEVLAELKGHNDTIQEFAFVPENMVSAKYSHTRRSGMHSGELWSGSADGTIRCWSPRTFECLRSFDARLFGANPEATFSGMRALFPIGSVQVSSQHIHHGFQGSTVLVALHSGHLDCVDTKVVAGTGVESSGAVTPFKSAGRVYTVATPLTRGILLVGSSSGGMAVWEARVKWEAGTSPRELSRSSSQSQ